MINIPLILIVILASVTRLFQLGSLPISLFGDEIDVGYHAWSLFTTGKDYLGNFLPVYIHSLSEWRAPLLMYFTAPFVGILGPSTFSVRLPLALFGIATVLLIYFFARKLDLSRRTALLSSLILAITPWHIHYSRSSFEVVPLVFLEVLGSYLFVSGKVFWSFIPFVLTFYLYSTASVFTPLLVLLLFIIYKPKIFTPKKLSGFIFPALLFLPFAYNVFFGQAAGRFRLISIFNDQKAIDSIILQRSDIWVPKTPLESLFHNKPLAFLTEFGQNYIHALSPNFLFLNGDPNLRQSVGGQGELLWICLPLYFVGLYFVLKSFNIKNNKLILGWLLLSPIASSLTQGGGDHATRLFVMLPPVILLTGIGLDKILLLVNRPSVRILLTSLFVLCFINYWHRFTVHYRYESARYWNNGFEDIYNQLKPLVGSDTKVYINNTYEPSLIRYAFYTRINPRDFQKQFRGDNQTTIDNDLFTGFQYGDNTYFGQAKRPETIATLLRPGDLYLAAQGREIPGDWDWSKSTPENLKVVGFVRDVFGNPQFTIVTLK